jgi:hypothetical protein
VALERSYSVHVMRPVKQPGGRTRPSIWMRAEMVAMLTFPDMRPVVSKLFGPRLSQLVPDGAAMTVDALGLCAMHACMWCEGVQMHTAVWWC